jgi:GTPase SAR1 family protein
MSVHRWRQKVEDWLQDALHLMSDTQSELFRQLTQQVEAYSQQLDKPLRVAVAGDSNVGKSTFINALLGQNLLAVGKSETTCVITYIRPLEASDQGQPRLVLHYENATREELGPFLDEKQLSAELERYTRRSDQEELEHYTRRADQPAPTDKPKITYVEVRHPNPILQHLHIIDTPGMYSWFEEDSETTSRFLATNVDALLYVIKDEHSMDDDRITLQRFAGQNSRRLVALNVLGVLTQIDWLWTPERPEPLQSGAQTKEDLLTRFEQDIGHLFFDICEISGLLALGAQTLTDHEFAILRELAALEEPLAEELFKGEFLFVDEEPPEQHKLPSVKDRQLVLTRLGLYGVYQACQFIRPRLSDPKLCNQDALAQELLTRSGILNLHEYLHAHFTRHSFLLRVERTIERLLHSCLLFQLEAEQKTLDKLTELFQDMKTFFTPYGNELTVLGLYYQKRITLSNEEVQELLRLTRQQGFSCYDRLGVAPQNDIASDVEQMLELAEARRKYWMSKANDGGNQQETKHAFDTLRRSYEILQRDLNLARKQIEKAERHRKAAEYRFAQARTYLAMDGSSSHHAARGA